MATSNISPGTGYAHKKFDCGGYKHKKFDRVLRRKQRKQQFKQSKVVNYFISKKTSITPTQLSKTSRDLFRPYALDATQTSCKRKMEEFTKPAPKLTKYQESIHIESVKIIPVYQQWSRQAMTFLNNQTQQQQPFAIDKRGLALMLQKQREVLYMRNFMQFNGNGNGWPTFLAPAPIVGNLC